MKHILITTIAAVLVVGCGESQQSAPAPEAKPVEPVAEAAKPEPPTAKAPDISIFVAAARGNIEAIKQHLAAGTDVNAKGSFLLAGGTPLYIAAGWGHKEVVELLINNGADVNAKDENGATPQDLAIQSKEFETADLLRKHGGKSGAEFSIQAAIAVGDIEAGKKHLAAGSDVNAKNSDDWTPLHLAADKGHKEIAELLIDKGADVNAKDEDSWTPLHLAASDGHKEVVELFIDKGADVNAKDEDSWTPLHSAVQSLGHREVTELLIAAGADVNAKSENGGAPLDITISAEISAILRKHGGKTKKELEAAGN